LSRLEALYAHRAHLEQDAEKARQAGDQKSVEMTDLLLMQCDFLIQKALAEKAEQ
jgi:hypothetical protein